MSPLKEFKRKVRLMGSQFEFIIVAETSSGEFLIDDCVQEVKRIETLLTEFNEDSQTCKINRAAGIQPVMVDSEVYDLIKRCTNISSLTQGAFDITAGALRKLYYYKADNFVWPTENKIRETVANVGYKNIDLQPENFVYLRRRGMAIGFGAIGKGYAADRVKNIMQRKGVAGGVVNASGDITAWGTRADGSPWKVGIVNPNNRHEIISWLHLDHQAIATSGDAEQFHIENGVRYSHIINPKSGKPITGMRSVTVVSPSAELSDALATAISIMGAEAGLHLVDQLPSTHCLLIEDNLDVLTSKKLKIIPRHETAETL